MPWSTLSVTSRFKVNIVTDKMTNKTLVETAFFIGNVWNFSRILQTNFHNLRIPLQLGTNSLIPNAQFILDSEQWIQWEMSLQTSSILQTSNLSTSFLFLNSFIVISSNNTLLKKMTTELYKVNYAREPNRQASGLCKIYALSRISNKYSFC